MIQAQFIAATLVVVLILIADDNLVFGAQDALPQTTFALNSCFQHVADVRLRVRDEIIGTESIQFKDDCLRACMRSMIRNVFTCRSLMHFPTDDDCLLISTDLEHSTTTQDKSIEFPPSNYYENICVRIPFNGVVTVAEAKFNGYKGGEGIIKFVQQSTKTKALLVLGGMNENIKLDVHLVHVSPNGDCYKIKADEFARIGKLFSVQTDSNGMAIYPWDDVQLNLNGNIDSTATNTIVIVNSDDHAVVDCGQLILTIDAHTSNVQSNYAAATTRMHSASSLFLAFVIITCTLYFVH